MPTGEHRCARRQHGFTYLVLLFGLALGGAALGTAAQRWTTAMQRERETELLFRGQQIQQAIESYAAVRPQRSWPPTLEALLEDRRNDPPRHHLRRLYADPFTGFADWRLLRSADGGITGVASRSERPAMRREGVPVVQPDPAAPPAADSRLQARVGDWLFRASGSNAPTTK